MIKLCFINTIEENSAREFKLNGGNSIFVVRKDNRFFGYLNHCPHAGWPLNLQPDVFLDIDKQFIQCSNHMALFEIDTGKCVEGPCPGAKLQEAELVVENDQLWLNQ